MSVLDWDELSGGVVTSSLHTWELELSNLKSGQHVFPKGPQAITDPQVQVSLFSAIYGDGLCEQRETHKYIRFLPSSQTAATAPRVSMVFS